MKASKCHAHASARTDDLRVSGALTNSRPDRNVTCVGLLEFFYSEAPKTLKSTATSFHWCSLSLGYFLSALLVQLANLLLKGSQAVEAGWWETI